MKSAAANGGLKHKVIVRVELEAPGLLCRPDCPVTRNFSVSEQSTDEYITRTTHRALVAVMKQIKEDGWK